MDGKLSGFAKRNRGVIIGAWSRAAGHKDHIGAGGFQLVANGRDGAINPAPLNEQTAVASDQAGEERTSRIMNGLGRQRCPRFSNVAAGEKATHPRLAHHRHLADVCRCEKPDVGRTQSAAGGCETTPASGVAARALDERSRNYGLQKTASTVAFV